jgi:hypothetical protein
MDLEHGDLLDRAAEAAGVFLTEQGKRQERLTVLESASGIESSKTDRWRR